MRAAGHPAHRGRGLTVCARIPTGPLRTLASLIVLLGWLLGVEAAAWEAKVVGLVDGDTVDVLHQQRVIRVRLNGVDAPERHQAYGTRARQFLGQLVFGQMVEVIERDVDRYGRLVADLRLPDGRSVSHELVRAGYAWWFRRYSSDPTLAKLEVEARTAGVGLWADPAPTPPWLYRRGRRSQALMRIDSLAHGLICLYP